MRPGKPPLNQLLGITELLILLLLSPAHAANVTATVTPQDVIVHFVGPQQFALACPKDTLACAVTGPAVPNLAAERGAAMGQSRDAICRVL
jgi:hypothetical protein